MLTKVPREFHAARNVRAAKLLDGQPSFIRRAKRLAPTFARGIRYERKALAKLEGRCQTRGAQFIPSPWIEFFDDSGKRWCQPDGVALGSDRSSAIVFEVKYRHTADAYFQLWHLYIPVLEVLFPGRRWGACEVCKWYDPAISFPEAPRLTDDPLRIPDISKTAVHIWNPARD